jgi:glutamate synthase (NADPH/NADH) small chain
VELAELDGADIEYGLSVESVNDRGPLFRKSVLDEAGKFVGLGDEEIQKYCDTTIFCVSQVPKNKLLLTTKGLKATDAGTLKVDKSSMTTVDGVFAAGDVVTGPKTVVHAVEGAKKAAEAMLRYMHIVSA